MYQPQGKNGQTSSVWPTHLLGKIQFLSTSLSICTVEIKDDVHWRNKIYLTYMSQRLYKMSYECVFHNNKSSNFPFESSISIKK